MTRNRIAGGRGLWLWIPIVVIVAAAVALGIAAAAGALNKDDVHSVAVPGVSGQPLGAAASTLQNEGLTIGTVTYQQTTDGTALGIVLSQAPASGTSVARGTPVDLVVAGGSATFAVPDLTGMTQDEAGIVLGHAGFTVGQVTSVTSSTVAQGLVVSQSPLAPTQLPAASPVGLSVSQGSAPTPEPSLDVPNVIGFSQEEAVDTLQSAGFNVVVTRSSSATAPKGTVVSQSPTAGVLAEPESTVTIDMSTGPMP